MEKQKNEQRIPYEEMRKQFVRVLRKEGFTEERAEACAKLFADTSLDGVYSHGLNRFPSFVELIRGGYVRPEARPELIGRFGMVERWDGKLGPGNLNAAFGMERAVHMAKESGIGCVALQNTNHWMRAGSYGLQAADAGCIGICWTNTTPNLPPWGAAESKVGNNPIVLAVPREGGHLLLDIAMSQFSYGQLHSYAHLGKLLPVDGGYDSKGATTRDPAAILQTKRPLPIGYWKGSGLALMLDIIGMVLSGGRSTPDIGRLEIEHAVTQIFLAIDIEVFPDREEMCERVESVLDDLHSAAPGEEGSRPRYPGEDMLRRRRENLERGIPADPAIWQRVLAL